MDKFRILDSRTYPQIEDGEIVGFKYRESCLKMACCDWGLTHKMFFNTKGPMLLMTVCRDDRATAQIRRHRKKESDK